MPGEQELRARLLAALEGEPVAAVEVRFRDAHQLVAGIRLSGEPDADETQKMFERRRHSILQALTGEERRHQFDVRIQPGEVRLHVRREPQGKAAAGGASEREPAWGVTSPVMTRLDPRSIEALDLLVEAGLRGSRSEAVAWCVHQTLAREADRIAGLREPILALRRARADLARPSLAGALREAAQQALGRAVAEARARGYRYAGTEHLLLALLAEEASGASALLADAGADADAVRRAVERTIPPTNEAAAEGPTEFTPMAVRVVDEISVEEARRLGRREVGPEHLLLGLAAAGTPVVGKVLGDAGVDLTRLRAVVAARPGLE